MAARVKVVDKDRGWAQFWKAIDSMKGKGAYAKVGVLADAEEGGLHVPGATLTVAEIAAVQEFGTEDGSIPSRSFVRSTFDEQKEELAEMARRLFFLILQGKQTTGNALNVLGAKLAAEIKKKITTGAGVPPPNAPSTIAAKGSDRPLVDTGRLVNAIAWAVFGKGIETSKKGE